MSLLRSSFWFTLGTVFSRFSGLLRDIVLSGVFGASSSMEAFLIANRIPNLFRDLLAEGALGSAFTKIYSSLAVDDQKKADQFLVDTLQLGVVILVVSSVLGIFFAPFLVDIFTTTSTLRPGNFVVETTLLTQLLFPFLGFAVLAAISAGVLQQQGRFFVSAVASTMLNVGYIVGALGLGALFTPFASATDTDPQILGLAVGVVLGGALHFAIQLWWIRRSLVGSWRVFSANPQMKQLAAIMIPATLASSAGAINLLVNTNFASSLGTGAVTWLNYAFRLLQLPIGIFAVSVASAALPSLSKTIALAKKVDASASAQLQVGVEAILWVMGFCAAGLALCSQPCIVLLFQHGAFTAEDAHQTARALTAYSFGAIGYGLIKVFSSYYFAVERTQYAMKVSLVMIAANYLLNAWLCQSYQHIGLAMTSSLTLSLNALLLWVGTRKDGVLWKGRDLSQTFVSLLVATIGALLWSLVADQWTFTGPEKWRAALQLTTKGLGITCVFFVCVMLRYQWSPRQLLLVLRRRKSL